jgi:hypothetical protein
MDTTGTANKNPAKERWDLKVGGRNEESFSGLNLNWLMAFDGPHKQAHAKCKEAGGLGQNAGVVDQHGAEQGRSVRCHHRSWSF